MKVKDLLKRKNKQTDSLTEIKFYPFLNSKLKSPDEVEERNYITEPLIQDNAPVDANNEVCSVQDISEESIQIDTTNMLSEAPVSDMKEIEEIPVMSSEEHIYIITSYRSFSTS